VWAGACASELFGLRGGHECSDLDCLRIALDGKRNALEKQPTKLVENMNTLASGHSHHGSVHNRRRF